MPSCCMRCCCSAVSPLGVADRDPPPPGGATPAGDPSDVEPGDSAAADVGVAAGCTGRPYWNGCIMKGPGAPPIPAGSAIGCSTCGATEAALETRKKMTRDSRNLLVHQSAFVKKLPQIGVAQNCQHTPSVQRVRWRHHHTLFLI